MSMEPKDRLELGLLAWPVLVIVLAALLCVVALIVGPMLL